MRVFQLGESDTQVGCWKLAPLRKNARIASRPTILLPPAVNVASGAQSPASSSMCPPPETAWWKLAWRPSDGEEDEMKRFTATAVALCLVGALTVGGISTATGSSAHHDDGQAAAI